MTEDSYNVLKILKDKNVSTDFTQIKNIVLDGFKYEVITKSDELLLNLIFSTKTSQEDLDKFLNKWDIEVVGGHEALMLAYFMKMHPELEFTDYVKPRLKGLIQFYRFRNLKLVTHYKKICSELKKHGIEFLIFKGGCIKHLRPDLPRVMGDIDILVHKKDYKKAGKIAEKLGYDIEWDIHSIDLHPADSEEGIMDIHKYIILFSKKEKTFIPDLFERATKQNVFGVETLVPCNEDLVFISLINMVRNLRNKTSYDGIPYTLFDCKFLINSKPDFDWNIILKNAKKTKTEAHIHFAIQFINSIVPNLLPEKIVNNTYFEKNYYNFCILLIYQRFYLWEMKQITRKMKVQKLFSDKKFFVEYLKIKPKYFFLKLNIIRKNPVFAKMILRRAGIQV